MSPLMNTDMAQKLFVGAYGFNAAVCGLTPSVGCTLYGLPREEANERTVQGAGAVGMTQSLMLYLQVFRGMSFEKAIGWSVWPYLLITGYQAVVCNPEDVAMDYSSKKHAPVWVLNLLLFYASQTQANWSGSLNAFYGYWSIVNALPLLIFTEETAKLWDISIKSETVKFLVRTLGYFLLAHGVSIVVQTKGTLASAIGWSAVASTVSMLGLLLAGQFKVAGVPQGPACGWAALLAVIAQSLLAGGQPPKVAGTTV